MTQDTTNTEQAPVKLAPSRKGRVYVAGPMTGIEDFNFPAFNRAAEELRTLGLTVLNPADHGVVEGATWADYLRHDIALLSTCERIHLLPGWPKSKGARLELHIAQTLGLEVTTAPGAERPLEADDGGDPHSLTWPGRWYSVDATGMATLCRDEADAIKTAADNSIMWPNLAPHKAVQLSEASALRHQHARDSAELRRLCQARDDETKSRKAAQEQLYAERERHTAEVKKLQAEIGRLKASPSQAQQPATHPKEQP